MKEKYRYWSNRTGEMSEIGVDHKKKVLCTKSYAIGNTDIWNYVNSQKELNAITQQYKSLGYKEVDYTKWNNLPTKGGKK
jgi:type IV secretory pathway component VirB8